MVEKGDSATRHEPLFIEGGVEREPLKYLGIRPYELDKYQLSILKKNFDRKSSFYNASLGATVGAFFLILGKFFAYAIEKKEFNFEWHEIIAVGVGLICTYCSRNQVVTEEEKEKLELIKEISTWFEANPNRAIHVSRKEGEEK